MPLAERVTFAIGDVHGCTQALDDILRQCRAYAGGQASRFIFIGDYIDRGPDSRAVIATVRALEAGDPDNVVCLMGNHEELLLDAIDTGDPWNWLGNNGDATLRSYHVAKPGQIPAADIAWMRSLRVCFDDGVRFFVHAGIDPKVPLDRQSRETMLWIREPFLHTNADHGRLIVHGHTPLFSGRPDVRPNRVNIDTGCVYGGVLTAAVFNDSQAGPLSFLAAVSDVD